MDFKYALIYYKSYFGFNQSFQVYCTFLLFMFDVCSGFPFSNDFSQHVMPLTREKRMAKFTDPQLVGFYFSDLAFPWLFPRIRGNATTGYKVDEESLSEILKETKKKKDEREEIISNIEILSKFLEEGKKLTLSSDQLQEILDGASEEDREKIIKVLNLSDEQIKNGSKELSGEELIWLLNNLDEDTRQDLFDEIKFASINQKPSPNYVPSTNKNVTSLADDAKKKIEIFKLSLKYS